jgi:hypothetical protein
MAKRLRGNLSAWIVLTVASALFLQSCGGSSGGGGQQVNPPAAPTGLTATAGVQQVSLAWTASSGATSYNVKRSTTHGGPYTTVNSPSGTSYTDPGLTAGTTYYYVVSAVNAGGESANSSEVSATPAASSASVHVTVDVLTNRHPISPYVYGGAYPKDGPTITDSGLSVVRWGGNATSRYNWKTQTSNSANDYYFSDYTYTGIGDSDSVKYIQDVKAAGGFPLMTMVMLDWVSRGDPANGTDNGQLYSYSVVKYGAQCKVRPDNSDAGNGQKTDCSTNVTGNDFNDAHVPIFDDTSTACPSSAKGPCVYRKDWATALATAFGSAPHFYDMDNEIDIWGGTGGTHHDVHPNPSGYEELRDTYLRVARGLKTWDPAAVRLGPVSCCWWFYWNSANGSDKGAHAGNDFLPWWLNEVYWQDQIVGTRSLDLFDIHAYPDGPDTSTWTLAQKQALAVSIYRDYWDPALVSPSGTINQQYTTNIQPNKTIAFRIPRMRAIVNSTYPGTPLAMTEWSAEIAGAADFSTALGDADAYGIIGRERVYLASRWTAPDPANPNYLALKLYTNYDGSHHGFATTSVSDANDGDPNLFSSYAALDSTGKTLTVMVLNKDPKNSVTAQLAANGFTPSSVVTYTLAATAPTAIAKATPAWSSTMTFAPYTATLLVITGTTASTPASEWDLNPDTTMVAAGGTVTLAPKITSGTANVSLGSAQSDNGITVTVNQGNLTTSQNGVITVVAGNTPGFYHYTVQGTDSAATQTQGGWIVVGNPAATFPTTTGGGQSGSKGTALPLPLTVTLSAGSSGGTNTGASVLFSTDGGSLSNGTNSGSKAVAVTNSSGVASVTLTLPSTTGPVKVTAEGPYGLGHPIATFSETSQ